MELVKGKLLMSAIITLIIVVSIVVIIFAYNKPTANNISPTPSVVVSKSVTIDQQNDSLLDIPRNAEISLIQENLILQNNSESSFDILIDTKSYNIVGVDVIINYDPELIEITQIVESGEFDMYPGKKIANGQIMFSGLYNIGFTKSGVLTLGTVFFKTLSAGETTFQIEFTPLQTVDSNVVESKNSQDILGKVNNLSFQIK